MTKIPTVLNYDGNGLSVTGLRGMVLRADLVSICLSQGHNLVIISLGAVWCNLVLFLHGARFYSMGE